MRVTPWATSQDSNSVGVLLTAPRKRRKFVMRRRARNTSSRMTVLSHLVVRSHSVIQIMRRNSANSTNEKNEAIIFNFLLEISCSMPMQHSMLDRNQPKHFLKL